MHNVITGGAGFIGSNVAAALLRAGERVTLLDSLGRRGTESNLRWLHARPGADRLTFVQGDVRDADLVRHVVGAADVERVFHFAAQVAVTTSLADPRHDFETNARGTFNVLEAARLGSARKPPILHFTSTNKVYGSLDHLGVTELATRYRFADERLNRRGVDESTPLDFHSPYGCSKGAADQYMRDYARIYGLRSVVFRMSCIYGTRQFGNEDQGWVAHFLIAGALGLPLTIFGNGKQVRDLLFVDDLVRAFLLASEHIDRTAGQVYNMGGGPRNSISIWQELQPKLQAVQGKPLCVDWGEWRPGDQPIYVSDSSKALRDFGWAPRIGVEEGLERLWSWIQAQRSTIESVILGPKLAVNGKVPAAHVGETVATLDAAA